MADIHTRMAELRDIIPEKDLDSPRLYRFLISTPGMKGDGLDIPIDSWDLSRFRKHPNVLVNHDIFDLPIGRAENVWTDDAGLWADVRFSNSYPKAVEVRNLIDEGILSSTSVNFRPHNVDRSTGQPERTELVELSIVSVPEDADVMMARSMWGWHGQAWQSVLPPGNYPVTGIGDIELLRAYTSDRTVDPFHDLPKLDFSALLKKIQASDNNSPDMGEMELTFRDALRDIREMAGQLSQLGATDATTREAQDTIVALRVLLRIDEPAETDAPEPDYSELLALIGAH